MVEEATVELFDTEHYGVLGLEPFSSQDAVKKAYRWLALELHPDK